MGQGNLTLGRRQFVIAGVASAGALTITWPALAAPERLQQRFGIIYFFAQSCAACRQQGPILRELVERAGFEIMAVSEDGGPSEDFPHYRVDTGQRARMGLNGKVTPTLALFDTRTRTAVKIGDGVVGAAEILRRITLIARAMERERG